MNFGKNTPAQRWMVKTPEQRFLSELQEGFQYAPRIAQVILEEAKEHLLGNNDNLMIGQMRVILAEKCIGLNDGTVEKNRKSTFFGN